MSAFKRNAYLTVYMSLMLAVMLSLCLALIEGVRSNAVYMESECVTDIGLNSIFAEYHRELLRQYNLFAIDSSYGTTSHGTANTQRHLAEYLTKNFSCGDVSLERFLYRDFLKLSLEGADISKASFLTDGGGAVFRRRAAEAAWDDKGLSLYRELNDWMKTVEVNGLTERDIEDEMQRIGEDSEDGEISISEVEWTAADIGSPGEILEKKRREGILKLVVEEPGKISAAAVNTNNLIGARAAAGTVNQGNMKAAEHSGSEEMLERFFFQEYLLRYMGNYRKQSEEDALKYQAEYLIAGKNNDTDNLRSVADTLCAIREVSNVIYIFSDQSKRGVAKVAGLVLATLMTVPEAAEVIEEILLFGWALAESIYDVECLLGGGRVPLMKSSETWHYDLETALKLDKGGSGSENTGLSYEDYLRILMMLTKEEQLTMRAMDMVEADIRMTPGNEAFRLDGCIDSAEVCVRVRSDYGYSCEITRQKGYRTQ